MTDKPQDGKTPETPDATPGSGRTEISSLPTDIQALIHELREENKKRRLAEDAAQLAAKQADDARLVEQQKWQELAEKRGKELDALKPVTERYSQTIRDMLTRRIETIPESMRGRIPEFDDPLKTIAWLDANGDLLTPRKAPNLDGGAGSGGGKPAVSLTPEQINLAKMSGMTPEQYATALAKQRAAQS